jgi:predicted ATPase/DNA-binding SARP family transcriptional activator/class 3 adenylate cyclase
MPVVVRILGPLEVEIDGARGPVRGTKRRGMLALLAARATTPTSLDVICDAIWPDQPLELARRSAQTYVSQFRRSMAVVATPAGYQLDPRTVTVDAYQFERLLAGVVEVDADVTSRQLEEALGLWRGPALVEFTVQEWAGPLAARWEELRRHAEDRWFAAQRASGFGDEIVSRLEAACAAEPLRESRWEQLILALTDAGRPAEALRAYGRIRATLRDEMGVTPSPALQDLELALLREELVPFSGVAHQSERAGAILRPTPAAHRSERGDRDPPALEQRPPRRMRSTMVRTFVLTDLVGSTGLWDQEPHEMGDALELHDSIVESVIAGGGGSLIQSTGEGDATLSVFADPLAAVVAAAEVVAQLDRTVWPTSSALTVRAAIHIGAAEHRAGTWFGATVSRAARLRALAPPGAVLISDATARLVRDELPEGLRLAFVGQRHLRGLTEPERIWAVARLGSPLPSLPATEDTNVPTPQHRLIGREADLERVERLLADHRLVTIVGPGGCGKTRLAVEVSLRHRGASPDGVWMVDLAPVDDPLGVETTVLSAVGAASLGSLADRRLLVVLDNCEHVLAAAAAAATALLAASTGVRVLTTSRQPLGLTSEAVVPISPLAVPTEARRLEDLASCASFLLFVDRARSVDPSFAVHAEEVADLGRLLVALDGMPLAIEIAASRVRSTSLTRLAASVEHELPSLKLPWRDASTRHRSVAGAIEWSLGLLDLGDREVFDALAICRGFELETAVSVTGRGGVSTSLARLVDASLVVPLGDDRFRLLEPVRQHAERRLADRNAVSTHAERLANHMMQRVRCLARRVFHDRDARRLLRLDAGNIEQALGWLLEQERNVDAIRLFGAIGVLWHPENQAVLARWSEQITPLLDEFDPAEVATARLAIGTLHQGSGESCAIPQLRAALDGFLSSGRVAGAATAAFWLAREPARWRSRMSPRHPDERGDDEMVAAFTRAHELAVQAGDHVARNWCRVWLGILAIEAGELDVAEAHLRDVVRASITHGALHPVGEAAGRLARIAFARDDVGAGRRLLDRAVAACRETGDSRQLANQLRHRAFHHARTNGQLTQAILDLAECAELDLRVDEEQAIADTLAVGVLVCDVLGEKTAAESAWRSIGIWDLGHRHSNDDYVGIALAADGTRTADHLLEGSMAPGEALRTIVDLLAHADG